MTRVSSTPAPPGLRCPAVPVGASAEADPRTASTSLAGINFQKASVTLDGCVKIYNSRVDSVTTETGRLLSGLAGGGGGAGGEDGDGIGGMDEDGEDGEQAGEKKEKRKVSASARRNFVGAQKGLTLLFTFLCLPGVCLADAQIRTNARQVIRRPVGEEIRPRIRR